MQLKKQKMSEVNWQEFKVRCSAISKTMAESRSNPTITEKQAARLSELESKPDLTDKMKLEMADLLVKKENGKKIILSDGCIDYLMDVYAWKTQRMISVSKESLDLMQMKKGKHNETDSIKLLSIVKGHVYNKNAEQVFNEYLTGEPDVFAGEEIMKSNIVEDTKTIWDYPGFLRCIKKQLEGGYRQQVQGYGDITGAKELYVSKCLVSASFDIIEEMKYRLLRKMNVVTEESPEFVYEWEKWERSMVFDHIPMRQRVFSIPVEPFTLFEQQKVYDRVKICREWLWEFDEMYSTLNKI